MVGSCFLNHLTMSLAISSLPRFKEESIAFKPLVTMPVLQIFLSCWIQSLFPEESPKRESAGYCTISFFYMGSFCTYKRLYFVVVTFDEALIQILGAVDIYSLTNFRSDVKDSVYN